MTWNEGIIVWPDGTVERLARGSDVRELRQRCKRVIATRAKRSKKAQDKYADALNGFEIVEYPDPA